MRALPDSILMGMSGWSALLSMPSRQGTYWYYSEDINDFVICEVVERDGVMVAKFADGQIQRFVGKKSYFIGPISKPLIGEDGAIGV